MVYLLLKRITKFNDGSFVYQPSRHPSLALSRKWFLNFLLDIFFVRVNFTMFWLWTRTRPSFTNCRSFPLPESSFVVFLEKVMFLVIISIDESWRAWMPPFAHGHDYRLWRYSRWSTIPWQRLTIKCIKTRLPPNDPGSWWSRSSVFPLDVHPSYHLPTAKFLIKAVSLFVIIFTRSRSRSSSRRSKTFLGIVYVFLRELVASRTIIVAFGRSLTAPRRSSNRSSLRTWLEKVMLFIPITLDEIRAMRSISPLTFETLRIPTFPSTRAVAGVAWFTAVTRHCLQYCSCKVSELRATMYLRGNRTRSVNG